MDTITSGATWTTTLDDTGKTSVLFWPPKPGKYCFFPTGTPAVVGVWQGATPIPHVNGKLRIEPGQKRGVSTLASGPYVVTVEAHSAGSFSLLIRPWTFWDYFSSDH